MQCSAVRKTKKTKHAREPLPSSWKDSMFEHVAREQFPIGTIPCCAWNGSTTLEQTIPCGAWNDSNLFLHVLEMVSLSMYRFQHSSTMFHVSGSGMANRGVLVHHCIIYFFIIFFIILFIQ